jgi:pimeloyl-ACP methyl ester carboxylesterase
MGAAASMLSWDEEFCALLANGARYVIRYDHRDTGRSVSYEPGAPPYTLHDLAEDAIGILDALEVRTANLVGMSMGGGLAQIAALDHPDRVASLVLIATSPAAPGDSDLPSMSDEARAEFGAAPEPDWADRAAVIDYLVGMERACAGRSHPFDEAAMRRLAGRIVDRTGNVESFLTNHFAMQEGGRWRERLSELRVPTLVIHGSEDPVLPAAHGRALTREIPGARMLVLDETGHELPRRVWDVVVPVLLEHTV